MSDFYDKQEKTVTAYLFSKYRLLFDDALRKTHKVLANMNVVKANKNPIIDLTDEIFGNEFIERFPAMVQEYINEQVERGYNYTVKDTFKEAKVERPVLGFGISENLTLSWLKRHSLYWIGEYYSRILSDKIRAITEEVIKDGLTYKERTNLFASKFRNLKKQKGYWAGFANHVVHNTRELTRAKTYEKLDVKYVVISVVLDHRTSDICRMMQGKRIKVTNAINQANKMLEAKTPEDVTKIKRWVGDENSKSYKHVKRQIKGDELTGEFIALPPYHFNCRTRSRILIDSNW